MNIDRAIQVTLLATLVLGFICLLWQLSVISHNLELLVRLQQVQQAEEEDCELDSALEKLNPLPLGLQQDLVRDSGPEQPLPP